jgi:hypothetical protein
MKLNKKNWAKKMKPEVLSGIFTKSLSKIWKIPKKVKKFEKLKNIIFYLKNITGKYLIFY